MKKIKRSPYDAQQPIVKKCFVDVFSVWNREKAFSVSEDLAQELFTQKSRPVSAKKSCGVR